MFVLFYVFLSNSRTVVEEDYIFHPAKHSYPFWTKRLVLNDLMLHARSLKGVLNSLTLFSLGELCTNLLTAAFGVNHSMVCACMENQDRKLCVVRGFCKSGRNHCLLV